MACWFSPDFPVRCLKWWCRRWKKPWICILDGDVAERCLWWCDSFLGAPKKPGEIRCPKKNINPTTPIAKSHISVDANLVLPGEPFYSRKIPFLQYHQRTTGAPPKQHRNTTKTWARLKTSRKPSRLMDTPPKCHQDANDHRNTIERPPRHQQENRHYQPSGLTPSGQTQPIPEKAREVATSILCHNIIFPSPSSQHRPYRHPPASKHQPHHRHHRHHLRPRGGERKLKVIWMWK